MTDVDVEVNGMPRHIRDPRRRMEDLSDDDNLVVNANVPPSLPDDSSDSDPESSAEEISTSSPSQLGPSSQEGPSCQTPTRSLLPLMPTLDIKELSSLIV